MLRARATTPSASMNVAGSFSSGTRVRHDVVTIIPIHGYHLALLVDKALKLAMAGRLSLFLESMTFKDLDEIPDLHTGQSRVS